MFNSFKNLFIFWSCEHAATRFQGPAFFFDSWLFRFRGLCPPPHRILQPLHRRAHSPNAGPAGNFLRLHQVFKQPGFRRGPPRRRLRLPGLRAPNRAQLRPLGLPALPHRGHPPKTHVRHFPLRQHLPRLYRRRWKHHLFKKIPQLLALPHPLHGGLPLLLLLPAPARALQQTRPAALNAYRLLYRLGPGESPRQPGNNAHQLALLHSFGHLCTLRGAQPERRTHAQHKHTEHPRG